MLHMFLPEETISAALTLRMNELDYGESQYLRFAQAGKTALTLQAPDRHLPYRLDLVSQ